MINHQNYLRVIRARVVCTSAFAILLLVSLVGLNSVTAETIDVWFGTQRSKAAGLAKGVYHAEFDLEKGTFVKNPVLALELESPGFLAVNRAERLNQSVIYATTKKDGKHVIASLKIGDDKALTFQSAQPIGPKAGGACHIAVDATGTMAVSCQYGSGTVAVFSLGEDGAIESRTQLIKHTGGSRVVGRRQNSPHAHYCGFGPENRFAFVCDLGLDRVKIYQIDPANRKLIPHGEAVCEPGGGPRHMKFHPEGKHAIVLNELAMSLSVFSYDGQGAMELTQTVDTISPQTQARESFNSGSEIVIHPNGKFVYSANRGNDTISVFSFDVDSGKLERIQVEPIRGAWPRNFNVDPSGHWLIAAGRDSNTATPFAIDQSNGKLQYRRAVKSVPNPICVIFTDEKQ